jgi:hypothetical protein
MYSFPNWLPLSAVAVDRILSAVEPFRYYRIYGAFNGVVPSEAKQAVARSAARYLQAIEAIPA